MKKLMAAMLAVLMTATLAACGGNAASSQSASPSATSPADSGKVMKIGIVQLMEHEALDAARKGFVDGLAEAGFKDGENIKIDYQNAQGEQPNCVTIAQKLVNDKSDLILAIATPAAQAVANITKEIPILVTAVTDPADAKLVATNDAPGGNVTGTSDMNPIEAQMQLLKDLVPGAKKVGMLSNSSESNSTLQVKLATAAAEKLGMEAVVLTVSNANEIQQVVQSAVGKVDVFYAPTDNMISNGMATVAMVAEPAKLPIICGEAGMLPKGGTATYGIDYYELGKLTALQAVKILKGEAKPAQMPIEHLTKFTLEINTASCEKLGITIPEKLAAELKK